jgi:hypothetical protein
VQELVTDGVWGLAPSPRGTFYQQEGQFIVPGNAPVGEYAVEVGFSPSYPPEYEQWTALGEEQVIAVTSRPLPTNGP